MLRPKLVLLLTDVLSELSFWFLLSVVLEKHGFFYTSAIPEVMWYEPLYNIIIIIVIIISEFFAPALTDGLLLEFEWVCSLDGLGLFSDF